jgi:DNA processing protein
MKAATTFGLSAGEISKSLHKIASDETDLDTFADIAWCVLGEPGDGMAGLLIEKFGPSAALQLVIDRLNAEQVKLKALSLGSAEDELEVFGSFEQQYQNALERWLPRLSQKKVIEVTQVMRSLGGAVVTKRDPEWPGQLDDLSFSQPKLLWILGNRGKLKSSSKSVAIVGSRASTSYGEFVVSELVTAANQIDHAVISGGAYGIDAAAHRNSLSLGAPTLSVLAGGLDVLYPRGNLDLLKRVQREGALISEVAPGVTPTKWRFLQRNRIIAALAKATVVVEAGTKSGARNTANHAIELQRSLGAIPGSITQPSSAGCNELIKSGFAKLIQNGSDLKELLGHQLDLPLFEMTSLSPNEVRALDAIGFHSSTFLEIQRNSGLASFELSSALGALELQGHIARVHAAWRRIRTN